MIKFDFIIISFNTKLLTIQCINSLYSSMQKLNSLYTSEIKKTDSQSNTSFGKKSEIKLGEVIVVDNGSIDGTIEEIKSNFKNVKLIENNENLGYAKACNIGIQNSKSDFFIISNSDIIVYPSSIVGIIQTLTENQTSLAGIQQLFPNLTWQRSWGLAPGFKLVIYNLFFIEFILNKFRSLNFNKSISKIELQKVLDLEIYLQSKKLQDVPYLDGAFLGFNRNLLAENCYLDEDFFFYSEELELCYRVAKKSKNVVFNPNYFVIHYRGGSGKSNDNSNLPKNGKAKFNLVALKLLYETKLLFTKKHLNKFTSKLYFFSEFSLFSHLYILSIIFGFTKLGTKKEIYKYLMKINFDIFKKI